VTTLAVGYDIDPSTSNLGFCRFRYYIALVLACWGSSCLILASIERTLVTSRNATTRKRSSRRLVVISMIILALFWVLFHIHALIYTDILQLGPDYYVCFYQPGAYTIFMTYYSLVINGSLPPLLMAIFGFWTLKNIRQVRRATQHSHSKNIVVGTIAVGRSYALQSKDQQLIRMLLVDILSYLLCKCPVTIFYIYQQITQYQEKTSEQQLIEQSILHLVYFWYFIDNSISCYKNISYRIETYYFKYSYLILSIILILIEYFQSLQ
jgi:hypothetical protein